MSRKKAKHDDKHAGNNHPETTNTASTSSSESETSRKHFRKRHYGILISTPIILLFFTLRLSKITTTVQPKLDHYRTVSIIMVYVYLLLTAGLTPIIEANQHDLNNLLSESESFNRIRHDFFVNWDYPIPTSLSSGQNWIRILFSLIYVYICYTIIVYSFKEHVYMLDLTSTTASTTIFSYAYLFMILLSMCVHYFTSYRCIALVVLLHKLRNNSDEIIKKCKSHDSMRSTLFSIIFEMLWCMIFTCGVHSLNLYLGMTTVGFTFPLALYTSNNIWTLVTMMIILCVISPIIILVLWISYYVQFTNKLSKQKKNILKTMAKNIGYIIKIITPFVAITSLLEHFLF